MKKAILKLVCLITIISLNMTGILAIGGTFAFFNDIEESRNNKYIAGVLDFVLEKEGTEETNSCFQTYSQGGWSSTAHGNNPGVYRDANFDSAFPSGASIGNSGGYETLFTSSEAVRIFLPAGGTSGSFTINHTDPISTEAGVLAGQILALTLNVGFDLYDPNFANSPNNLEDFIIDDISSFCYGMTVKSVLEQGNLVLAGLGSVFTPSQINDCADWINNRFEEEDDECSLSSALCPGESLSELVTITNEGSLDFQYIVQAEKTDGDDAFCNILNLEALVEGSTNYSGSLLSFLSSPLIYSASTDEWEFIVSVPENSDIEGSCNFTFVFSGWQTNFPSFGGFTDTEKTETSFVESGSSCSSCNVEVIYPDGGETWFLVPSNLVFNGFGRYEILWKATSFSYNANDLDIDIWFCKNSGTNCFHQIVNDTQNDGSYWWTLPYDREFITDESRIKIVASGSGGLTCEDMSDADFCPPMLTEEDVMEMMLSVHSASELMAGFEVESSDENATSSEDSDTEEDKEKENDEETIFELNIEDPIIEETINPIDTVTPQQDGVEIVEDNKEETPEEDLFELDQETQPVEESEDPINTVTPPEDGTETSEEDLFELDQEIQPIEEPDDPINTVTPPENGIENQ